MIHDTVADQPSEFHPLKAEVDKACAAAGISQNEFARKAQIDPSIMSRVLRKKITSEPAEKAIRVQLGRMRRVVARARAKAS
jgi:hypothetical protein